MMSKNKQERTGDILVIIGIAAEILAIIHAHFI